MINRFLMRFDGYMESDPFFCTCGCASWYWNVYRLFRKVFRLGFTKDEIEYLKKEK